MMVIQSKSILMEENQMNPDSIPQMVDEHRAAEILGLAVQTMRNHRSARVGCKYFKIGRSVRYRVDDILDFIEKHRIDPEAA